ncbi:ctenidin-1-like [Pecten maximus]|uniref:ctenidin-1-like n=1 Tax=Pecten maximus TaxID=6579 RepID=UPI001458D784|nr:ctenidin-1-like [Pecten maximus]
MRFACAVLASLACLSVAMGDGYGGSYYTGQNMYNGYGKGGMAPVYNYGGYGGYGKGGGYSGYGGSGGGYGGGYGGYPTLLYPVASPEPADIPLGALGGLYGGGGGGGYGGGGGLFSGDGSLLLLLGGAILLMALLSNNTG